MPSFSVLDTRSDRASRNARRRGVKHKLEHELLRYLVDLDYALEMDKELMDLLDELNDHGDFAT